VRLTALWHALPRLSSTALLGLAKGHQTTHKVIAQLPRPASSQRCS
jgi:hypothetical protein